MKIERGMCNLDCTLPLFFFAYNFHAKGKSIEVEYTLMCRNMHRSEEHYGSKTRRKGYPPFWVA